MSKTILAGALMAAVLLVVLFAANADSGHGHKADSRGKGEPHGVSEGHGASAKHSATLASAWSALMAARDAIASDVVSGALGDIHEKSEPLPQLVAALVKQSGDLDSGKLARVQGAATQITRVADALHEAADVGDAARTRKELSRLDGLLKLIRVQYASGALDTDAHGEHGHEDHSDAPENTRSARAYEAADRRCGRSTAADRSYTSA